MIKHTNTSHRRQAQIETNMVFGLALMRSMPSEKLNLARARYVRDDQRHEAAAELFSSSPFFNMQKAALGIALKASSASSATAVQQTAQATLDHLFGEQSFDRLFASRGEGLHDLEIYEEFGTDISDRDLAIARMSRDSSARVH